MSDKKSNVNPGACGIFWLIGWLFSIGFLIKLGFGKAVLGIILWPYYLGNYFFHIQQAVQ